MTPTTRIWFAFASLGAGMIHLAVAAGAPLPVTLVLAGFGVAELGWGAAVLIRGKLLGVRVVLGAALVPVLFWGALATVGSGLGPIFVLPLFPMAVAALFDIALAAALAVVVRAGTASVARRAAAADATGQGWRFVAVLGVAGALFSGLVTPALAATDAGSHAVPHGSHSLSWLEPASGHSHH